MKTTRHSQVIRTAVVLAAVTFSLAVRAQAQTESTLYTLTGGTTGSGPDAGVVIDSAGNLFGVTEEGGQTGGECYSYGCGVVYELSPDGAGGWIETVIYTFTGGADGHFPDANLMLDAAGNLYGTAAQGGNTSVSGCSPYGCGVVFELSPSSGEWTETVLHAFRGSDGSGPNNLIRDAAGNFYGTTGAGGTYNKGTVFKLTANSTGYTENVLHHFTGGTDGWVPDGLVMDATGNLYGSAFAGGNLADCHSQGCGLVFKLTPGSAGYHETVVYNFVGGTDGINPNGVVIDAAGRLYGTTYYGGDLTCNSYGCGTVFRLINGVSGWRESLIHTFAGGNGRNPGANLTQDASGNLYGTASTGGVANSKCDNGYGCGVVFKLTATSTGGWIPSVLHAFHQSDGFGPQSVLTLDAAGNIYGTTIAGGVGNFGVVFEIQP
jgi:uncharacterized repeat protein (TIGR03803 family)